MNEIDLFNGTTGPATTCIGEYFRYKESAFAAYGTVTERREFQLLRSISCKGCGKGCSAHLSGVDELICDCGMETIEFDEQLTNGCIAELTFIPDGFEDYSSNILSGWHYKLSPVSPEKQKELEARLIQARRAKGPGADSASP